MDILLNGPFLSSRDLIWLVSTLLNLLLINWLVDIHNPFPNNHLRNFLNSLSIDYFLLSLFWIGDVEAFSLESFPFSPDIFLIAWSHSLFDDVSKLSIAEKALVLSIKESEEHNAQSVIDLDVQEMDHLYKFAQFYCVTIISIELQEPASAADLELFSFLFYHFTDGFDILDILLYHYHLVLCSRYGCLIRVFSAISPFWLLSAGLSSCSFTVVLLTCPLFVLFFMNFHLDDLMYDLYMTHRIVDEGILYPHDAFRVSSVPNYLKLLLEHTGKLRAAPIIARESSR